MCSSRLQQQHACCLGGVAASNASSSRVGATVHNLLQRYKERCSAERKRPRHSSESPPALLPVSFAQAKDWLLRQQKSQCEALQTGAINEEAREVVIELNRSLAEHPALTAVLLEQPACPASPVVPPPPAMSLGPEPVTDHMRAEECAEEQARRKAEQPPTVSRPKRPVAKRRTSHQSWRSGRKEQQLACWS